MSRLRAPVPGRAAAAVAIGGVPAVAGLAAAGVLLAVGIAWPLATVLVAAVRAPVAGADLGWLALNSLALAVASTAATLALAAPLAYALARADVPGRHPLALAAGLPLLAPPFAAGLAVLVLLGPHAQSLGALVGAQALAFVPHACVLLAAGLGALERDREAAAESLGAGRWTVFHRITLPRAWPALRGATLSVFVLSLADLGNPLLVGREHPVLTREIYTRAVTAGDATGASALAVALLVPCLAAWWLGRAAPLVTVWSQPVVDHAHWRWRPMPPAARWPLTVVSAAIAIAVAGVVLVVGTASVVRGAGDWSLSLIHWKTVAGPADARAVGGSVALALLAGVVGSGLTLTLAYLLERPRLRAAALVGVLATLPAAVPGATLGMGYLLALGAPPASAMAILIAAMASVVCWRLPEALEAATATLKRIDPATESAALGLGAGRGRTVARVVLPSLATTGVGVFAFFFVKGLVTVATVAFLASPSLELAAPAALARAADGAVGEACALATLLLGLVVVALLTVRALAGHARAPRPFL